MCHQADVPEYQVRIRWEPNLLVLWDNYAVQHYAVNDYWPQTRTLVRATIDAGVATGVIERRSAVALSRRNGRLRPRRAP